MSTEAGIPLPGVSVNALAEPLVADLQERADELRLGVEHQANGCTVIDAGIDARGGMEAGRRIAEICMGGLGGVTLTGTGTTKDWPLSVHVHTQDPVLACLGSQYAGWSLTHDETDFFALGSGPGRSLSVKEALFQELGYTDQAQRTCLVLEVDARPPQELTDQIAAECGLDPQALTLILTPTQSLAGATQVVARVLEVALHKAHEVGFPLGRIVDGAGSAPLCPPAPDFVTAMGRTNDAVLFGGSVQLFVTGGDEDAQDLAQRLPSNTSSDYGRPFGELFQEYDYDFFQIDPMLFSPARVSVTALESGHTLRAGGIDELLLERSFGGGA